MRSTLVYEECEYEEHMGPMGGRDMSYSRRAFDPLANRLGVAEPVQHGVLW